MSKITRFTSVASLGVAILAAFITPASAASPIKLSDIYNPLKILKAEMTLPQSSVDSLNNLQTLTKYVPGTIAFSVDGKTSGTLDMKVRLKGSTSLFPLNETPSFKLKFKKDSIGNSFLGLSRMTLNGMVQDTSKLHEFGAYQLFNAMGVQAPLTGWARLYVNGVDRGLFVNVEQPDQVFAQKRFRDITQHIYEGVYFQDFNFGNDDGDNKSGSFLVDYGWKVTPNKDDLSKAIDYVFDFENKTWYPGLNTVFDRTAMIKFFAVETYLSHWDGYSGPDVNNYFVRSNTRGKFTFIPWGTDQTFGENRGTKDILGDNFFLPLISDEYNQPFNPRYRARGMIYTRCVNYAPCRTEFLKDLRDINAKVKSLNLAGKMKAAAKLINPVIAKQFEKDPKALEEIYSEQTRTYQYLTTRSAQVTKLLAKYKIK